MSATTRSPESARSAARSARPMVVAALCAALFGVPAVAAQAQTMSDPDALGDLVTFDDNGVVPAPERALNDVSATRLTHGFTRVGVRVDYADLQKGGDVQAIDIDMVTNEGVRRHLQLAAYPRHWSGETQMYTRNWRAARCSVRHSIDYEAKYMKVSLPRRCLSNPRWVQFRVGSYVEGDQVFIDDALRDRPLTTDDRRFKQSDRVYRAATS